MSFCSVSLNGFLPPELKNKLLIVGILECVIEVGKLKEDVCGRELDIVSPAEVCWTAMWRVRFVRIFARYGQCGQANGFSPVWIIRWRLRRNLYLSPLKALPHTGHMAPPSTVARPSVRPRDGERTVAPPTLACNNTLYQSHNGRTTTLVQLKYKYFWHISQ